MTYLSRAIAVLVATVGIIGAQAMVASPLLLDIGSSFDVTTAAVGTALSVYGIATALSALLVAPRVDRFRRGRALGLAMVVMTVGLGLIAVSPNLALFAVGHLLTGGAAGVLLPGTYAAAGDIAPPEKRSAVLGKVLLGWSVALVLGVPVGGVLGEAFGWRGAYGSFGAVALLVAGAVWFLPEARTGVAPKPSIRQAVTVPGVIAGLVACWCVMAAFYGVFSYVGSYFRVLNGSGAGAASLLALAYGLGFSLAVGGARWIDRWGSGRMLVLVGVGAGCLVLAMPWAAYSVPAMLGVMACFGLTQHMVLNSIISWLGGCDPARRGSIMAVNSAVTYAGLTLGTASFGWVYEHLGFVPVTLGVALLYWASAVVGLTAMRKPGLAPAAAS
ncbi:MFS transporter [Lacibacterium aquatile]|uniref:MFS transporter n=1 Tax=Lacibacterium aquatile TaxID=1168082 RepID=A0ABW5DX02_9PROT